MSNILHRCKIILGGVACVFLTAAAPSVSAVDSPALTLARQLNEAFIEVADKVSPAVVVIEVTEKPSETDGEGSWWDLLPPEDRPHHHGHRKGTRAHPVLGEGSGIVITPDGYILTNAHVVENTDKIEVRFKNGRSYEAEIKGIDTESDIAVIKIKATGLTPAKLGDSDTTRVGEFVLAVGAPFALSYSVTFGHVSAKGRFFEDMGGFADQDFIQTDASINPGNSGGPLVNLYGEVIAINTMIEGMNTGIGFAVPINLAKRVKDHLIAEGKFTRSWIGIGFKPLSDFEAYKELDKQLSSDAQNGILVTDIMSDGPAAKSGLRTGDIILSIGGKQVENTRQLKEAIAPEKPGSTLVINVIRGSDHMNFKIQTAPAPTEAEFVDTRNQPEQEAMQPSAFGLTIEALTKESAQRYGLQATSGVMVTAVDKDSAAGSEGIQPGDIITRINHQRIGSPRQFHQALRGANPVKGVLVDLISNGSSRLVILQDSDR